MVVVVVVVVVEVVVVVVVVVVVAAAAAAGVVPPRLPTTSAANPLKSTFVLLSIYGPFVRSHHFFLSQNPLRDFDKFGVGFGGGGGGVKYRMLHIPGILDCTYHLHVSVSVCSRF